ncbi:hypothetical protein MMC22_002559 [Lobaria immixta]|nr:hypothetical protein [Lobaria immixta]
MSKTKDERKKENAKALYAERQLAKAESAQAQEGGTNAVGVSAYAPIEQVAESSTMGASRDAIGGRFVPSFGIPFGQRSDLNAIFLSQDPTDLVSSFDETMVDAAANEAALSTNPFADVTYGPQETNPIVSAPGSNEGRPYVNPGDITFDFAPTQHDQIPIDPILLRMDAEFFNGRIPIRDPRDAEQFLRDAGVQPQLPGSKQQG